MRLKESWKRVICTSSAREFVGDLDRTNECEYLRFHHHINFRFNKANGKSDLSDILRAYIRLFIFRLFFFLSVELRNISCLAMHTLFENLNKAKGRAQPGKIFPEARETTTLSIDR